MRKLTVLVTLLAFLIAPLPAYAAGKKLVGGVLLASGIVAMIGAFDYGEQCPPGYTTHTFQGLTTQCVFISSRGSDVQNATNDVTYKRPGLMYGGAGAALVGVILLLWPDKPANTMRISVTPGGWVAQKVVKF